ncbi:P-loop ATPase, Sll1717 family [Streptococcus sanguinis]|uniref:P-loop ATPase, Sll1717 family n=2 Tax=Streptococcus sanguinis TaxID=1305 RepID=UPI001CBE1066|nr:hypothetical protein [Streptococcus sanguinis]MBZ2041262.1 hypothetical protein [Streptococcus sanguinis]
MNIDEVTMKDFNFGDVSGSEESQEPKFQDLFYDEDSKIENQVNSKKKFIIYGRKGTGKTLLASYINEKNKKVQNRASKIVSYDEYILEKLKEFKYDSVKKEEQSLFWRYVFLQQFIDLIKDDFKRLYFWQFFKKYKIKKLLKNVERQFWEVREFIEQSHLGGENMGKLEFSKSDIGFSTDSKSTFSNTQTTTNKVSPYFNKYEVIESIILNYIENSSKIYTIFFDDMDRLEEIMDRENFLYFMISMINGAQALNKKIPKASKIILLLRSDVIKLLFGKSGDINKPITSGGIELRWYGSNSKASGTPLMKMIFHKMSQSIDTAHSLEDIRNTFFPKKETVFFYIMSRTFGRPRDVVAFLNIYKKNYPNDSKVVMSNLIEIEKEYSDWFYREISNELKMTGRFDEINDVIGIISELGKGEFAYLKIEDFIRKRNGEIGELLQILTILVNHGVLGIKLNTGSIEFRYRDFNIDKPVSIYSIFVVHYGLRKLFSIDPKKQSEQSGQNIKYE